jgi:hypothetical protein
VKAGSTATAAEQAGNKMQIHLNIKRNNELQKHEPDAAANNIEAVEKSDEITLSGAVPGRESNERTARRNIAETNGSPRILSTA